MCDQPTDYQWAGVICQSQASILALQPPHGRPWAVDITMVPTSIKPGWELLWEVLLARPEPLPTLPHLLGTQSLTSTGAVTLGPRPLSSG